MCHLYPYNNVKLLRKFFTLIFAVLLVGANFYKRPEYLTIAISNLNFNFPPLIVHRYQQVVLKFRQRVLYPQTPLAEKINFLISTFCLQQFPRFQGVPYLSQGSCAPLYALQRKIFCTRGEYVTMSNGIFNFNFLALLLSEILGVPNLHQGALRPLDAPQRRIFFTQSEYFTIYNCVFNFNILALVVFELLGGRKFTLGGSVPPVRPLGEKFLYPRRVLYYV